MSADFKRRNIKLSVRLTESEHSAMKEKMKLIGVTNQEAFMRKMILDGLIVKLELPEIKTLISLMRFSSNNINQIAKRLNERGRIYKTDLEEIAKKQEQLWELMNKILTELAKLK